MLRYRLSDHDTTPLYRAVLPTMVGDQNVLFKFMAKKIHLYGQLRDSNDFLLMELALVWKSPQLNSFKITDLVFNIKI